MRCRKSLLAGVSFPVVEHPDVEIGFRRQLAHRLADVAAANDEKRDSRKNRQVGKATMRARCWPLLDRRQVCCDVGGCFICERRGETSIRIEQKSAAYADSRF